jgi:ribonuclease HII
VHVGEGRRMGVAFLTEGENAHLPVALASMTAKLTRELLMRRFNAYWSERHRALGGVELRPTAGYALDARRWLRDVGESMPDDDREVLVRIA